MKTLLVLLISFVAVTALLSGILLLVNPDGTWFNLSLSLLQNTPFNNFMIPGIILTTGVGAVNAVAVYSNIKKYTNRYNWAIAGGVMILGWIIVQVMLIETINWLHFIYLSIGLLIILIAWQLKGKWAV